ncbi:MAG: hypothetical protein M3041_20575 [Acidobacteriota bacterium]|nr:hypothetical protein [Acidobacteriota bacterium]
MRRMLPAILALSVLVSGCKVKEMADKARIAKDLDKRGTVDLMKEVANDKYDPPKDNKLSEPQVQMYLKVREHEKDIAKLALQKANEHAKAADASKHSLSGVMEGFKTMSAAAEFATADIRAAKDLGYNTQEYLWVKGQIMAASAAAFTESMSTAMSAQVDASRAQMKKAYDEAKDEQTKQMYKQMLDGYEQTARESKQAAEGQDPSIAYNRQLLKKYDTELAAFTSELSKYENKEGDAKKSMDERQQKMNQAAEDAKKNSQ